MVTDRQQETWNQARERRIARPMSEISKPVATNPVPALSSRPAWIDSLLRPILAFRLRYVPVVMVYFAYGALGLIDVTRDLGSRNT